jgi:peptidoglycan/xylan/chitin deacetylase (PgdA/CDA1 family)
MMNMPLQWLVRVLGVGIAAASSLLLAGATAAANAPALPILVYHQIRDRADGPPDSFEAISLARFEEEMRYLHKQGYVTLSVDQVVDFVRGGKPPGAKIVAIHFDDGWKSAQLALPVLDRYGFKATFWIIAGKGIGWPHMDWDEVLSIARNPRYDIQSHTMTHPWKHNETMVDWIDGRTSGKGIDDARWELVESRRLLAEKLGRPVTYLAWPAGLYNDTLIGLAEAAGYHALFTIDEGVNRPDDDLRKLRRTSIHGGCDNRILAAVLRDGVVRECKASVARNSTRGPAR